MHESIRKYSEKVRKLTLKPMLTSPMSGMVGDERIITDSGELLEKGTIKFCRLHPPRLDSFL
jgi:hypothetical protein